MDIILAAAMALPRRSVSVAMMAPLRGSFFVAKMAAPATKDKEYVRSFRPSLWMTEQFSSKTEELLPLLDILASKVKAIRRVS